jgi:hypothetical protein
MIGDATENATATFIQIIAGWTGELQQQHLRGNYIFTEPTEITLTKNFDKFAPVL